MLSTQLLTEKGNTLLKSDYGAIAFIAKVGHNAYRVVEYYPNRSPSMLVRDMTNISEEVMRKSMEPRFKGWKPVANQLELKL